MKDVLITVHGTWAHLFSKRAPWTLDSSNFIRAMRSLYGNELPVESFTWSGYNRILARSKAADELHTFLLRQFLKYPDARFHVVTHSHGGNVALLTLNKFPALNCRISNVFFLSTPFLHITPRKLDRVSKALTTASFYLAFVLMAALVIYVSGAWKYFGSPFPPTEEDAPIWRAAWGPVYLFGTIFFFAAIGNLHDIWEHYAKAICNNYTLASSLPPGTEALIIRDSGDEASIALAVAKLGDFILSTSWRLSTRLVNGLMKLSGWWDSVWLFPVTVILVASMFWAFVAPHTLSVSLAVATFGFVLTTSLAGPLYWLSLCVVILCISPLMSILMVAYGPALAFFSPLLEISAEATPPGKWTVFHLPRQRETAYSIKRGTFALQHFSYDHPAAHAEISRYILKSAKICNTLPTTQ